MSGRRDACFPHPSSALLFFNSHLRKGMKPTERIHLTIALSDYIDRSGLMYPSENPSAFLEYLMNRCGETPETALMYYFSCSGVFTAAAGSNATTAKVAAFIQEQCGFKRKPALDYAGMIMGVYSKPRIEALNEMKNNAFDEFCQEESFEFTWQGQTEWRSDGGTAECTGDGTGYFRVSDRLKLAAFFEKTFPTYAYASIAEIEDVIEDHLRNSMDQAFDEYCNEDDYYPPVVEDFEFEDALTNIGKPLGLEVVAADFSGECGDWEPKHW